jgi:hypothetical protein
MKFRIVVFECPNISENVLILNTITATTTKNTPHMYNKFLLKTTQILFINAKYKYM